MEQAIALLKQLSNIKSTDAVVVAVSGGPDSMALLSLLKNEQKERNFQLVCAHVHHNKRKESDDEAQFVENYCKENQIIYEMMKIEHYGDDNFHNEARSLRYQFFESLLKKYHANYLFTAHHADDLMETILMRIVRGSSMKGYRGFDAISDRSFYKIVRPLIFVTKEQILDYLNTKAIDYVLDQSNGSDTYTRNRYRKKVLPFLKSEEKNVHQKFYQFHETLLEYQTYVEEQVKNSMSSVLKNGKVQVDCFQKLPILIQKEIMNHLLAMQYQDDLMLITSRHVEGLLSILNGNKQNVVYQLPNQIEAIRSYNEFSFEKLEKSLKYQYEFDSYLLLPNGKTIECTNDEGLTDNFVCYLNREEITLPLTIRSRENGDKMEVKGLGGHKKISDIFIELKIGKKDREMWPVVEDANGVIVWLPGLKKSKFDRTKEGKYDIILKYY